MPQSHATSFAERYAAVEPERLRRLHGGSFVFDYQPLGDPFVMTPRHRELFVQLVKKNAPITSVFRIALNDRLRELAASAEVREIVAKVWRAAGVNAVQVTLPGIELKLEDWDGLIRDVAHWTARTRVSNDMRICTRADELEETFKQGKVGLLLGTQDAAPINRDLERLTTLHHLGLRVVQLTYNIRNLLGDGCTEREQSRLSKFGVQVVRRCNELGIIVDVSHCGYATGMDAIEVSEKPVAITHACCQAVYSHPRAKSDEQLRVLRDRDGYFGVLAVPSFIADGGANLEIFLRHLEHAVNIVGIERVGIATDGCGFPPDFPQEVLDMTRRQFLSFGFSEADLPEFGAMIPEFPSFDHWPNFTRGLMAQGFSDEEIRGLIGGNWLKYMRRCGL